MGPVVKKWKGWAKRLKVETYTLYLAYKHPQVPWYTKVFIACVVAYAFSPIDLIPDFIPILGYIDDLILLPVGIMLALKMIPGAVLEECRAKARDALREEKPVSKTAVVVIVLIWVTIATVVILSILGRESGA